MMLPFFWERVCGTVAPSSHEEVIFLTQCRRLRSAPGFTRGRGSVKVPFCMIDTVRGRVDGAKRVVVLTGAGISTDSGIPDFRGPHGVWTRNPEAERLATLQHYLADPEVRKQSWQTRMTSPMFRAEPNSGHRAIADLERLGKVIAVITQNVDGLH